MRVNDVMTADAKTCDETDMVAAAAKRMRDEGIGDVLVVDGSGALTGIVTDRDIVVRVVADGKDAESVPVGEVCSRDPITLSPEQLTDEAARVMREHAVRRLPVVSDGRPVGMVSLGDLAIEREPESALADISAQPQNSGR